MTAAILWAVASSGFWPGGSWQAFGYPSLAACEEARPRVEAEMRAHGYTGIRTTCMAVKERGT